MKSPNGWAALLLAGLAPAWGTRQLRAGAPAGSAAAQQDSEPMVKKWLRLEHNGETVHQDLQSSGNGTLGEDRERPGGLFSTPSFGLNSPNVVDGYTDCQWNDPHSLNVWWDKSALGHNAAKRTLEYQATHYQIPGRNAAMCLPAKNGCTFWKALFMRMEGNELWNDPNEDVRHNPSKTNLDKLQTWDVFKKPDSHTIMLVRNPVARVLSAFLDKQADTSGYYHELMKPFPRTPEGFEKFINTVSPRVRGHFADGHWRRQMDTCGLSEGATWDFYLKVECRALWGPALFNRFKLNRWTDSGWGSDGRQPFIPTSGEPTIIQDMKANNRSGRHSHRADRVDKICKWYTETNFLKVAALYAEDIVAFGYLDDVQTMAKLCHFRTSLGFPPH